MRIRDILKEFAPGGSGGNGPFDYGAAIIKIGETFVDHYADSAAGEDAAMIIAVGETFMNRGMMPGIKALFELDTQLYDHVLDELANEGFNVEQDIIAQRRKIPRDPKAGQLFAKARADWEAQAGDVYQVTGLWGTGSSVGQDIKARSEEEARQKFLASNPEYKFKSVDVKRRGGAAGIAEGKFDPRTGGQTTRDYSPDSDDFKTPQEYDQATYRQNPWQAVVVDRPGFLDFEVQLTNPLTQQQLNFIMRPVDMITSFGGGEITPDTFDVRDLQTGKTTQWDSGWGMPMHHTAAWFLFADDPYLQKELQKILAYYKKLGDEGKRVPEMPGLVGGHQPAGQSFSAQDVIDSGATDLKDVPSAIAANKAAAAIAKAKAKKPDPGVEQGRLNEFAPGGSGSGGGKIPRNPGSDPWGDDGDDDDREPPYKYPKPRHYAQSIDFFSQFEADHFDREDFDDATGVFKGYWGDTQVASFKFTDPNQVGPDDPGMGWYYEPDLSGGDGKVSRPAAAVDNPARREEQKRQELSLIDMFLKSGQTPKPGSQIYDLMKRHGMLED